MSMASSILAAYAVSYAWWCREEFSSVGASIVPMGTSHAEAPQGGQDPSQSG